MVSPDFLLQLLDTTSPSGWETATQQCWKNHLAPIVDQIETDAYGNAWATLHGAERNGPKIMLEAHADEIGFIIRHIDDKGFVSIAPIGGSDRTIAAARRIRIFGDCGEVTGIIGNTAIHLRAKDKDKLPEWHDLFVDVGASSAKEAEALGLRVGCPAVYWDAPQLLPSGRIVGRAIDNRVGGYLIAKVLENLAKGERPAFTTVAVNAVQEEIGSNGAMMVAHRLSPDLAIIFDVTHATDTPGINPKQHGNIVLGGGPSVSHGAANHAGLVAALMDVAKKEQIPLQHEAVSRTTSTDTDVVFTTRSGIPSMLISIPLRYMHSPSETIDLQDVDHAVQLVTRFIQTLPADSSLCNR